MNNLYGGLREIGSNIPKLDLKDRRILAALCKNARAPLSSIAKDAGLSRDSVEYRINGYRKDGILGKEITVVRSQALGYALTLHLYLKLNNPSQERERLLIGRICEMPSTIAAWKFFGAFDIEIAFIAKDPPHANSIISDMLSMAGGSVQDYELVIWAKNYLSGSFPKSFLKGLGDEGELLPRKQGYYFGGRNGSPLNFNPKRALEEYMPDRKDMAMLKVMGGDARIPLTELAKKAGLSQSAARYRLKTLKENLIVAFIPTLNYEALGYTIYALLLNVHLPGEDAAKRLQKFFYSNDHILWAIGAIGRFNVIAYVCCRKESELQQTLNELRHEFHGSIKEYELLHAVEEYKYTYTPDCLFE